jgi:hypothetical protein
MFKSRNLPSRLVYCWKTRNTIGFPSHFHQVDILGCATTFHLCAAAWLAAPVTTGLGHGIARVFCIVSKVLYWKTGLLRVFQEYR